MRKIILSLLILSIILLAKDTFIERMGVKTSYIDYKGEKKKIHIIRKKPKECAKISPNPSSVWGGNYASKNVPNSCKKTYRTYLGKIAPIKVAKGIVTFGELEVLNFIKKATINRNFILIDTRTIDWYKKATIPSALNVPYVHLREEIYPREFKVAMKIFNITKVGKKLNYKNAKTLVLFCNGTWCEQSSNAIKRLIQLGYPKNRLFWYRGGVQNWSSFGFPVVGDR